MSEANKPAVQVTLRDENSSHDLRGDFGIALVRQGDGGFQFGAGYSEELTDEAFGRALSDALLVFVRAVGSHPAAPDKVRRLSRLFEDHVVPRRAEGDPDNPVVQASDPSRLTCSVGGTSPAEDHGDFALVCVHKGEGVYATHRSCAPAVTEAERGDRATNAWVALTQATSEDPSVPSKIRKWCGEIALQFDQVVRLAAATRTSPN